MNQIHDIGVLVTVRETPGRDAYVVVCTQKNGRTLGRRTAIKNNIQGHVIKPNDASKYQFGQCGTLRGRVTAARKQTLAFGSSARPNHVPPFGGFPGSGQVVDLASQNLRLAVRPGPCTADQKTRALRLF
jgi:hypothetical protein